MAQKTTTCPFCKISTDQLILKFQPDYDEPLLNILHEFEQDWRTTDGVCTRCLNNAHERLQDKLLNTLKNEGDGIGVLPTHLRLNAHPDYTGKGVTICFVDSGFYPHPDIVERILKIQDITQPRRNKKYFLEPHDNAWHGTMTSVVCAGNGRLSNGIYKGIASDASLVLLKVMDDAKHISAENIAKALLWIDKNHKSYNIKIVNLSVTGDEEISYHKGIIAKVVRSLTKKGIVIVAAVGNDRKAPILPPANIPEVLAVGGLDDHNTLDPFQQTLYNSTAGLTIDGLLKPELIAPAIWLAAPILPKSTVTKEAAELFEKFHEAEGQTKANYLEQIKERKLLSASYQHSDGTSFAAPIVCSIIAQMLEANPTLKPSMIREILLTTARPLPNENRTRQGYGVVQAANAVIQAKSEVHSWIGKSSPVIDFSNGQIHFYFHRHDIENVALSGNFNKWSPNDIFLKEQEVGLWQISLPIPPKGNYLYKYVIDGASWAGDPQNLYREEDGYGGFNSKFFLN